LSKYTQHHEYGAGRSLDEARSEPNLWGRIVESAVGAHILNTTSRTRVSVHYWRRRNREVDFVLSRGREVLAIEVKSGRSPTELPGIAAFSSEFSGARALLVGGDGIPIEQFLSEPATGWFD
jgi:hypothetical protein